MFWRVLGIACAAAAVGGLVAGVVIETKKRKTTAKTHAVNRINKIAAKTKSAKA